MEVDRLDGEVVATGGLDRLGQPFFVDPEFRRPLPTVGEALVVASADAGIDPEPDPTARCPPPDPLDLADRVEVEMNADGEERVEVALGQVGAGEADLLREPAVGQGMLDLARRAGVDAHSPGRAGHAQPTQDRQDLRLAVGLEREADPVMDSTPAERPDDRPGVLGDSLEVVHEQRRPVLTGQRLGVLPRDRQPAVTDFQPGPVPPARAGDRG